MIEVAIDIDKKITCKDIQDALHGKYSRNCRYKIENVFLFKDDWESDFIVIKENGYVYEFEIKLTRSDFLADFKKKQKHSILLNGSYQKQWDSLIKTEHKNRPNRFYYVSTPGVISRHELPPYAGLITIHDKFRVNKIKEAPFIHMEVIDYEKKLARKFYNRLVDARFENRTNKIQIRSLKNEINNLKNISS